MLRDFVVLEPFYSFAHLPNTAALLSFFDVDASTVLFTLIPLALVASSVGPCEGAVAVFLIILVFAYVLSPVAPREHALALHSVVDPIALEDTAVGPNILADSVDVVLLEIAVVGTLVAPDELSSAVLHSFDVFSGVLGTIWPLLDSFPMLLVVEPLALVPAAIIVGVNSEAIGLVLVPGPLINITLRVDQASVPTCHTILPKPVVSRAVWPNLDSTSISLIALRMPLSLIHGSILKVLNRLDHSLDTVVDLLRLPIEWLQRLNDLLHNLIVKVYPKITFKNSSLIYQNLIKGSFALTKTT